MAYSAKEEHEEAIAAAEGAVTLTEHAPLWLAMLGADNATGGQPDRAWQIMRELEERAEQEYVAPTHFAHIYIVLARKEEAFTWLETAYEQRDPFMTLLRHPFYDPLRSEPRFQELLRRMNLA